MTTENQVPEAAAPTETAIDATVPQTVPIETLDQFANLVASWHNNAVATVRHLAQAPEGLEVVIEGDEPFKLEGDTYRGFHLGLELALNFLGRLPFVAEHEPVDTIQ